MLDLDTEESFIFNLEGPYAFNLENIINEISEESLGNYILGFEIEDDKFFVEYVGRSDSDVNDKCSS